jgi:hypothetical protein
MDQASRRSQTSKTKPAKPADHSQLYDAGKRAGIAETDASTIGNSEPAAAAREKGATTSSAERSEPGLEQQLVSERDAPESASSEEQWEVAPAEAVPRGPEPYGARPDHSAVARKEEGMAPENEAAKRETADAGTSAPAEVPVTEQPVPSKPMPATTQYVVTVDNETGIATKVERIDEETGNRTEVSADEYAAMYSTVMSSPESSFSAPEAAYASDPLLEAYYQGVADYLQALTQLG